jgi:hypothetical protein
MVSININLDMKKLYKIKRQKNQLNHKRDLLNLKIIFLGLKLYRVGHASLIVDNKAKSIYRSIKKKMKMNTPKHSYKMV